jgi:NADH-quinone oxidoreductase subunit M
MNLLTLLTLLLVGGLVSYFISRVNKVLGAWMSVIITLASLAVLFMIKDQVGDSFELLYFSFTMTEIGWYFSFVLTLTYGMSAFYNVCFMDKFLYPHTYLLLYLVSLGGSVGLFFAKDFITFFVFWELVVWSSAFIIPMGKSRRAAFIYYVMSSIGSMMTLFAILWIYKLTGSFVIKEALTTLDVSLGTSIVLMVTFLFAGLTKIGIFPFHIWLPLAHGSAPHTFSPILSGGLVKLGAFVAYLSVVIFPAYELFADAWMIFGIPAPLYFIMILGAISIIIGTLMAIRQEDAKKLLAYSSVANGGYILIGILMVDQITFAGGLLHLFAHAIASATAFLTIAAVAYRTGTTKISELGGMIHRMPITYTVYLISIISMAGIPPMAGFVSKWLILQGLASKGLIILAFAAFFGSIGSFLYVFRPLAAVFLGQLAPKHDNLKEAPLPMLIPMILMTIITLTVGVVPKLVLEFIIDVQREAGIQFVTMDGGAIDIFNGYLDATRVFIIFGYGFVLALILFLLMPKTRSVDLMDTYTSAEFIYTPELLHYAHDFYAPFERLYEKHPSTLTLYERISLKIKEVGLFFDYAVMSHRPSTTVMWIIVCMMVAMLGGAF